MSPRALADDVGSTLDASGVGLGKRPIHLQIGVASADPAIASLDDLALQARTNRSGES